MDVKVAASGGRRRRAGFYSAIRREVPIRTFNDWNSPPPGFCEVDMVAHGGTSVTGSFIQTLTMVDVATGWTECLPLVTREGSLVVEAINRAQSLFPWLLRGVDFDNDSAFMNDVVVPGRGSIDRLLCSWINIVQLDLVVNQWQISGGETRKRSPIKAPTAPLRHEKLATPH
ncbi:hypothetical protein [Bradyrhizobium sp. USDA 336]|uniref:hypothetical protein n=1 Tax=Bradyrhizobium sp. USDA 336 TaxID=3156311 RepID=UPI0038377638